jgi:hypothetical protein
MKAARMNCPSTTISTATRRHPPPIAKIVSASVKADRSG